jgi:hypothetical protein
VPDAIQLLNQDHRTVEELFSEFERSESWEICEQICMELEVHAQIEEEIVYPALAKIDRELEKEAEKEHQEAKQLIARIRRGGEGADNLTDLMLELKQAIEHHVEEEESEAWTKLRDGLGTEELEQLGTQLEERKQALTGEMAGTTSGGGGSGGSQGRLVDLTKEELYEKAKEAGIDGRSSMTKDELVDALQRQG